MGLCKRFYGKIRADENGEGEIIEELDFEDMDSFQKDQAIQDAQGNL